jgi:hypothetical protein
MPMAMGRRPKERQGQMWVEAKRLSKGPGHPFYGRLDEVLAKGGFDIYVEELCKRFYAKAMGRPSLPPSVYFRLMLIGYFERIESGHCLASDGLSDVAEVSRLRADGRSS